MCAHGKDRQASSPIHIFLCIGVQSRIQKLVKNTFVTQHDIISEVRDSNPLNSITIYFSDTLLLSYQMMSVGQINCHVPKILDFLPAKDFALQSFHVMSVRKFCTATSFACINSFSQNIIVMKCLVLLQEIYFPFLVGLCYLFYLEIKHFTLKYWYSMTFLSTSNARTFHLRY